MRILIKVLSLLIVTFSYSTFVDVKSNPIFISTIYNISGIMFSIGLGLIITFNISGVKNPKSISKLRLNIKRISRLFISYFCISSLCYLLSNVKIANLCFELRIFLNYKLIFSFNIVYNLIILYSIVYFIINFLAVRKLNDDLYDKINKENNNTTP